MKAKNPVCYLDMDGVLTDFTEAALQLHGRQDFPRRDLRWDFPAQIGFAGAREPLFWHDLGYDFWRSLPWTHEGKELLAGLEEVFSPANVVLLTSPCNTAGCVEGKLAWVAREMPEYKRRVMVGPAKHLLAAPSKVLIDDSEANVDAFTDAGGKAVLVPRPWNRLRGRADDLGRFAVGDVKLLASYEWALAENGL